MNKRAFLIIGAVICVILIYTSIASTSAIKQTKRLSEEINKISQKQDEFSSELRQIALNLLGKNQWMDEQENTKDEMQNWKIYKSEKYNFELKYPPYLIVSTPYGPEQIRFIRDSKNYYDIVISTLSGEAVLNGKAISYSDLSIKEQLILDLNRRCQGSNLEEIVWKTIKIGGIDGFQAVSIADECAKQYLPWSCVIKGNLRYYIKFIEGDISEYNLIISTIRF